MAQEFKLKDAPSLSSLKEGDKVEVEVEGLDGTKVLLVQVGGKTHAVGPKCTHFGAPLKNGVLSASGRLTCPWHGACFQVATGDVEDAPAPDGLATFEIREQAGGVYVKGEEALVKSGRRSIQISCQAVGDERVVIVGG
jgi:nitrite reductase/ring-hydroxylating ferredoxin subunit